MLVCGFLSQYLARRDPCERVSGPFLLQFGIALGISLRLQAAEKVPACSGRSFHSWGFPIQMKSQV